MLLALQREEPVHIGTNSEAMLTKLNVMLGHARDRDTVKLYDDQGRMRLGGHVSPLHAPTPFKKKWHQQKDGDLWEQMHHTIKGRGHASIKGKKVKGHATASMVEAGEVSAEDKDGNDWADLAAGKGTSTCNTLATMAKKIQPQK